MKNSTRYRIIELLRLLSNSVLPIIFWIGIIFGFDAPYVAILTIICAVVHELGHCIAIAALGSKGKIRGHSSGFRIAIRDSGTHKNEIAIRLAGPGINIALFLATLPFGNTLEGYVSMLGYISLATGISNLLPLEGYDGYGAISELLLMKGCDNLQRRLEAFSFIFSVAATFIALYLIDRFSEGYWIFGLFFIMTLSKICYFGKYDIFGE